MQALRTVGDGKGGNRVTPYLEPGAVDYLVQLILADIERLEAAGATVEPLVQRTLKRLLNVQARGHSA